MLAASKRLQLVLNWITGPKQQLQKSVDKTQHQQQLLIQTTPLRCRGYRSQMMARLLWIVVASLTTAVGWTGGPPPCLMRCKDNHLFDMKGVMGDVSEWSVDFVAPLQAILKASTSNYEIHAKLQQLCRANGEYETCLSKCKKSTALKILVAGQGPSRFICTSLAVGGIIEEIMPCWNQNRGRLESVCWPAEKQLKDMLVRMANTTSHTFHNRDFGLLCRSAQDYESCWLTETRRYCGRSSAKFLIGLSQQTTKAMHEMLKATKYSMPSRCKEWLVNGNYTAHQTERFVHIRDTWEKDRDFHRSQSATLLTVTFEVIGLSVLAGLMTGFR